MVEKWLMQGAQEMGLTLTQGQQGQLAAYHDMLVEAGRTMNLTRIPDDAREAVDRNYLDSLSPLAQAGLLDGARTLIDVGSGAGLPGIPLSIALAHVRVTLVDALGKRVHFLQSVIDALGLNACAVKARSEDAARDPNLREGFDVATARAVADMALLCELTLPFVRVGGKLICYKGPAAPEELSRAQNALARLGGRIEAVLPAPIPGRDWEHRLVVVKKETPTPARYPRKAGIPERKPL